MLNHIVSMAPKEYGVPTKIHISHQQIILAYKTWYKINAIT